MRILIADDHGIVREGLRSLLRDNPSMEVIGEAEEGDAAVRLVEELHPDIVIMDITMPRLNGIEAIREIVLKRPMTKVLVLSMHAEGRIVRGALEAGASGYVLKSYLFEELLRALRALADDEHYLSTRITDALVHEWLRQSPAPRQKQSSALTGRDRQILQLTAEGKSAKEIALHLHISPKTVHGNRRMLMRKLGVSSPAELTKYAISEGLTSLEF